MIEVKIATTANADNQMIKTKNPTLQNHNINNNKIIKRIVDHIITMVENINLITITEIEEITEIKDLIKIDHQDNPKSM